MHPKRVLQIWRAVMKNAPLREGNGRKWREQITKGQIESGKSHIERRKEVTKNVVGLKSPENAWELV